MRLVSVVTSTRWFASPRACGSRPSRSSTWPFTGRTSTSGSTSPVGRMICSTTTPADLGQLVRPRRRRDVDHLVHAVLELLEGQRPVVERARQAESVRHQRLLARPVAVIHAVKLRNRLVAFVEEHQGVVRQVIEQRGRRLPRQASGKVPRVVLDAVAVADLLDHLQIEHGALVQPLRLDQLALFFQLRLPPLQLRADARHGALACLLRHHIVRLWDRSAAAGRSAAPGPAADRSARGSRPRRPTVRCGRRSRRKWGRSR